MRLGYAKLKREQEDVVTAFLSGRDVFSILSVICDALSQNL